MRWILYQSGLNITRNSNFFLSTCSNVMAFSSAASELGESPAPISKSEYRERQEKLYSKLSNNSVLILCSSPTTVRSNDVHHPYRTSSDLLYLTGWSEPTL